MTPVTASEMRTAEQVVLIGEVFLLHIRLRTRRPGADADWDVIETAEVLDRFEAAGQKAIESENALGENYRVTVEALPGRRLLYRVTGYDRLAAGTWGFALPGSSLEYQLLKTLKELTSRVEKVGSEVTGAPLAATAGWEPRPGLSIVAGIGSGGPEEIEARILHVVRRRRRMRLMSLLSGGAVALLLVVALVVGFASEWVFTLPVLAYAAIFLFGGLMMWATLGGTDQELIDLRDQQDLSGLMDEPLERRAQKLFQVHSHQLKRYYDQALRQRGVIFSIGLLCIAAGFGIVAAAFWFITHDTRDLSEQIVIGSLGAVGGILSNFIAVVYLRMFSETVKSIGGFHDRLVLTHHLHFANFLAAKVSDEALRDQTLAHMAEKMAILDLEHPGGEAGQTDGQVTPAGTRT
jgi:MFS family permease